MNRIIIRIATLVVFGFMAYGIASAAQVSRFDGDWAGTIYTPEGKEIAVRIIIRGEAVAQYFRNEDGSWRAIDPDRISVAVDRNNAVVTWMNSGGSWSESQIYSLSMKSSDKV